MAINPKILEHVVLLRQEEAQLLGFKHFPDYCIAPKMAKDADTVMKFLRELVEKTNEALERDFESIRALKKEEMEKRGLPYDPTIWSYDFRYYVNMIDEKKYNLNQDLIQQYFPVEHVTEEMLKIYQEVLGLVFKPCPNPHVWHEDVVQYEVYDSATNAFMGQFIMDLYPRDGKYGHAAVWGNQKGCVISGKKQYPCPGLVCNFPKPQADKPALLTFDDVVVFFHEFGHAMHGICTNVPYWLLSGTSVQRDFVETPSQMLENWCYEKAILERLSKHYQTQATLPEEIRQQLVAARLSCTAVLMRRQLFFCPFRHDFAFGARPR
jgi:thimet oligopeptidase